MSDQTTNLALPYILPSQAQKHVTHNEALQKLDVLVQLTVTATQASPPAAAADGACYAVGADPVGLWTGKAGKLAFLQDGLWSFLSPKNGWRAWFLEDDSLRIHDGTQWAPLDQIGSPPFLGINTTADITNRLSVAAAASLFTHAGNGHQMKVNKAAASETASLLFQSGWSGRAEMGLTGNDDFSLKVSPDGTAWATALTITSSGTVRMPERPLVRASLGGGLQTPPSGSRTGFNTLSVKQGGFALGAPVAGGTGNRLVVPVTGPYLVALRVEANPTASFTVGVEVNGATVVAGIGDNVGAAYNSSAIGLALLTQGDWISLLHTGAAPLDFGYNKTELSLIML